MKKAVYWIWIHFSYD